MPVIGLSCLDCRVVFTTEVSRGLPPCPTCGSNSLPNIPEGIDDGLDELWAELPEEVDELDGIFE